MFSFLQKKSVSCFQKVDMTGSGASSTVDVYKTWAIYYESMRSSFIDLQFFYDAKGSSRGKQDIIGSKINFAGSDIPLNRADEQNYPDIKYFPSLACKVKLRIYYNNKKTSHLILKNNCKQIVGIYNGTITNWNDSSFMKNNPSTKLPDAPIIPIARLDDAGSTFIFSSTLSSFDINWNSSFGTFQSKNFWPKHITIFGQRISGMADTITNNNFSIGYLSTSGVQEVNLSYAKIINKSGKKVDANIEIIQETIEKSFKNQSANFAFSLTDLDIPSAYPILSFSYILININNIKYDCSQITELYRFFKWSLQSVAAHKATKHLQFVPLP
ncbi:hypothetical protein HELRODRAFT_69793, partial [Helobdella robusta]|uniref:PBP domain-containing protein n=1 Tax=Helobdella robusta TaxID=6412 RepID=T1FZY5_HELRO